MDIEINKLYLSIIGAALMLFLVILETFFPERHYDKKLKGRAYITNILLFGFNNIIFIAFNVTSVYLIAYTYRLHNTFDNIPLWGQAILGILLLDLFIWLWHVSNHKINFLWRFHKAHHSEQYLNATSAIRFHFGELILSVVVKSVILIVFGISFWIFILYETLVTFFATFHHSNIKLPQRFQRLLEYLIISPDMHRTHHSAVRDEHDSNYGVIFSLWDFLFQTFDTRSPENIGLQNVPEKTFLNLLSFPFHKK
jgi:sterol desaturase/sphingolipid hydroxylase (fatty acid hydroxylase superfamily)